MRESLFKTTLPVDTKRLKSGERFQIPCSALGRDSVYYAQAAREAYQEGAREVIVVADPLDVTRLSQEIAWLDPAVKTWSFPDWETLPYDMLSPQESLISERLETLYHLSLGRPTQPEVVIVSAITAAQRLAPPEHVHKDTFFFEVGFTMSLDKLRERLVEAGYSLVKQVLAAGEFAIRGDIVDVFPMGSTRPFRLDLFDDEIESIRWFDVDTQRSMETVNKIRLLPGREFPVDKDAILGFRQRWRETFSSDPKASPVYRDIGEGLIPAGVEYYLPLFFEKTATIADYLPDNTWLFTSGDIDKTLQAFMQDTHTRYQLLHGDKARPPLSPDLLWLNSEAFFTTIAPFKRLQLKGLDPEALQTQLASVAVERKVQQPLEGLLAYLDAQKAKHNRTLILASSLGREQTLFELFRANHFEIGRYKTLSDFMTSQALVGLTVGPLFEGALLEDDHLTLITETELYRTSPRRERVRKARHATNVEMMVRDVSELRIGAPVVHMEHGVGRYLGLETHNISGMETEFLAIGYKDDAKLLVPVQNLDLISRYAGTDPENAPLHGLGRGDWEKQKKKAQEQIRDTAAELLALYALRDQRAGHVFRLDMAEYERFREGFAFEETPDQAAAIQAVIDDMTQGKAMDRLVCGDVGFGKTEVALRAAFIAVNAGKQVAVLTPTTLLAEQHAQTFKDRFADWPVRIGELSRFRTGKETSRALEQLEDGTLDIVIGTHKLLTDKVKFKRLGLVIIDEEHRFGVRQKEMLKALRAEVDVLTLTATPIPRTLSMSLEGIRDFSVIATAPEQRLAIKTFVHQESPGIIREAMLRELKRGGQVYFLHNEVSTIENRKAQLQAIMPEARIAIAHGQMSERELESIMRAFYQQHFNVLLCTTIIETGIDVPTANTIIMDRADRLGLAQMHQLRGRVGRSYHQAYAYLLTPAGAKITPDAERRLEAIQSLEDLGSGFYLAMHDMEIRGAGEVLGEHQSGSMTQIGFELYQRLLKRAVKNMQDGQDVDFESPLASTTEINLHAPALLPSTYVEDVSQRLGFYKELSSATDPIMLRQTSESIVDRYGALPEEAQRLLDVHRLRIKCESIGVKRIDSAPSATVITFMPKATIDPLKLIQCLQSRKDARMAGPERMRIEAKLENPAARYQLVDQVLTQLGAS